MAARKLGCREIVGLGCELEKPWLSDCERLEAVTAHSDNGSSA
jgi:hypothetical protein